MPQDISFRDLQTGDIGWLIQRHAERYAEDEGFDHTFEALVAEILANYLRTRDPSCERAWIAHRGDQRLGSIFCTKEADPGVAKLRMFYLEPELRGLGLGHQMMDLCLSYAKDKGYKKMRLYTHESHAAACALYAQYGFNCISSTALENFGQSVIEQHWEITF